MIYQKDKLAQAHMFAKEIPLHVPEQYNVSKGEKPKMTMFIINFYGLSHSTGIFRNNKSLDIVNKDALTYEIITSILSFLCIF